MTTPALVLVFAVVLSAVFLVAVVVRAAYDLAARIVEALAMEEEEPYGR